MKYCKSCGAQVEENKPFCGSCGKPVENEEKVENLDTVVESEPVAGPVTSVNQSIGESIQNTTNQTVQQYGQQPVQPVYNQNNNNKKSNKLLIILVAVLGAVIVGLVVVILLKTLGGDDKNESSEPKNEPVEIEDDYDDNTNNDTTVSNDNTQVFKNYKYVVPDGFQPSVNEKYLKLLNAKDAINILIYENLNTSYESYVQYKEDYKNAYLNAGYKLYEDLKEETYLGKKMLTFKVQLSDGSIATTLAVPVNSTDCIEVVYVNAGSKTDAEVKTIIAKIASYATRVNSSFSGTPDEKFAVKGSNDLINAKIDK